MRRQLEIVRLATCDRFGVRNRDLARHTKEWEFWWPRAVAMFLARELLRMPYKAIGRAFKFDHGSVMNACRRVRAQIGNYPRIKQDLDWLTQSLTKQLNERTQ